MPTVPSRGGDDAIEIEVDGRPLRLSHPDKVIWPRAGLTKGWMVAYYFRVAAVLVPHLRGRPLTLHRYADGVNGPHWYQTRAPAHPSWVQTVTFSMPSGKTFDVCVLNDLSSLLWAAQMGSIELHPFLGSVGALQRPHAMVFDLDPGAPATIADCCQVAVWIRDLLADAGLRSMAKTSGWSGLHVYVPLDETHTYDDTKPFARAVAQLLARAHPDRVVAKMGKELRTGRVFIDWSQNDAAKSTVAPYSLRGRDFPTVSTPIRWDEVERALGGGDGASLDFGPKEALHRTEELGDLFSPVKTLRQRLPSPARLPPRQ